MLLPLKNIFMAMERMFHYIWKHRLFAESGLVTTDGLPVIVIDPGIPNTDAGPDFFNAKVRIGNTMWAGNVEIHDRSSDWFMHHHDNDKAYDSVILHVVRCHDVAVFRTDNEPIPQMVLPIPQKVKDNIEWLLARDAGITCSERLANIPSLYLSDWMSALLTERMERKTADIFNRLENHSKDWNEMFYMTLMRSFGFGVNSDAIELLAGSLPFKYILKHRNNPQQLEALFLGQAGLLSDMTDHCGRGRRLQQSEDPYFQLLQREYDFLSKKYKLSPVDAFLFKSLRTRPVNFPHVRLAQAAAVWIKNDLLFSKILETESIRDMRSFFNVNPSDYWETHYNFRSTSEKRKKAIGSSASDILLINAVIPVLFAYGKYNNLPDYCDRALRFMEEIKPERNRLVTIFKDAGIPVENAGDTQALIQLRREYCDKKKCLYCRIGFRIISK